MRRSLLGSLLVFWCLAGGVGFAGEIAVPNLAGDVLIAETFSHTLKDGTVVWHEFEAWPRVMWTADTFTMRIEAHPGDTVFLEPGTHDAAVWVFSPGITITTAVESETLAQIRTLEVDADRVTVERIAVGGPQQQNPNRSGHGIEVNRKYLDRIVIRDCAIERNDWTGIHIIGASGWIVEMRIENCRIADNGQDGMDSRSTTDSDSTRRDAHRRLRGGRLQR